MKKQWLFKILFLFVGLVSFGSVQAQQYTVTGKVIDLKDGSSLPGVTIIVKGTSSGSITDIDGKYSIKATKGQVLQYSFIGYKTQDVTVNGSAIDVKMEPETQAIDELVVIGYGTVKKSDATGSVTTVTSKDFNKGAISSPEQLIAGKISGVQITTSGGEPGAGSSIRIRGGSSLAASNDPLVVIDGVPVDNGGISGMANPLASINPNDIETFTVLKDASATAIYGSRASNGVIIITTKTGKRGKKISVDYSGNVSVGTRTGEIEMLSADQFRAVVNELSPNNPRLGTANINWQDEIFRNAISTDHNVSVSGAAGFLPYRVAVGYTDENGMLKTSNMKRTTTSVNLNPTFFDDHLKVNLSGKYTYAKNRFADKGAIGNALSFNPTVTPYAEGFEQFGGFYTEIDKAGDPIKIAPTNPLSLLYQKRDISDVNRVIANGQIDYKFHFLPELRANLNVGIDRSDSDGSLYIPENAAFKYEVDENGNMAGGETKKYSQTKQNKLLEFYFNYAKDIASIDSRIDVTAGYTWQHFQTNAKERSTNIADNKIYADKLNISENYLVSLFARVNYSLMNKYLLTATVRRDGSSRFSEDNRWGVFPSVALGWNLKEESFLKNSNSVSQLKLRLGYGITGQQNISNNDYPYMPIYTGSDLGASYPFDDIFFPTYRPEGYDANIKWEETVTYNVALDYGFFNNRITGTLDVYKRKTNDLINKIPVPAGTNLTNEIITNIGNLENSGVEFSINAAAISKKDFVWNIGVNATYNKNKITKLTATDDPEYLGIPTGGVGAGKDIQIHSVGYAANTFFVFEQVYDANGKPIEGLYVDRNNDGLINDKDLYHYKGSAPDVILGISSSMNYKNWDFSFSGRANLGNYNYNDIAAGNSSSDGMVHSSGHVANVSADWLKTGFKTRDIWRSDYFVQKASFFRMDNISLGYTLPKVGKYISNLRVYGSVQNAFVITKYEGLDPEVINGLDGTIYPRPRTFVFGVNLSF